MVRLKNRTHPTSNKPSYSYIDGKIEKLVLLECDDEENEKKKSWVFKA